jgi:hypothetical protein
MGLSEKRAVKRYQDENFIRLQADIAALVGKEIPFEIDWASLPREGSANFLPEGLDKVYFLPVIKALESVCSNGEKKSEVAKGLRKIVIVNGENALEKSEQDIRFAEGVLYVNQRLSNFDSDYEERIRRIAAALETGLKAEKNASNADGGPDQAAANIPDQEAAPEA